MKRHFAWGGSMRPSRLHCVRPANAAAMSDGVAVRSIAWVGRIYEHGPLKAE